MMIPFSPISGLSLTVHLLIILLAKLYIFFTVVVLGKTEPAIEVVGNQIKSSFFSGMKIVFAIFVIIVMLLASVSFLTIAVQTALRVGEENKHTSLLQNTFSYIRDDSEKGNEFVEGSEYDSLEFYSEGSLSDEFNPRYIY